MPNLSKVNNVTGDTSTISKINGVAVTGFNTVDGQTFVTGPAGLEAIDPDESLFSYSNTISQQDSVDSRDITISIWLKDDGSSSGEDTIFNMGTSGSGGLAMNYQNGAGIRIMSLTSSTWEFDYTIDANIDLGFDVSVKKRIRFMGINTPESRTRDLEEKKRGLAAKQRVAELLDAAEEVQLTSHGVGKFGRCLGEIDFCCPDSFTMKNLNKQRVEQLVVSLHL